MDETLKNEISNLCTKILSHPNDQSLANLIEKLEELQEKLLIQDYLQLREKRFQQITKRLEQQLQSAVAERPFQSPLQQLAANELEMVTASLGKNAVATVNQKSDEPIETAAPLEETPHTSVTSETDEMPKEQPLLFEPAQDEPTTNTEKEAFQTVPKQPTSPRFIPNPTPTITAKRTAAPQGATAQEVPSQNPTPPSKTSLGDASTPRTSLNDRLNKNLNIGLNDRIAFVKHLFGGSQEDFNRVISQLNTMTSFEDAQNFVVNFVKPDYNWTGKEEYEERLLEIITKRFEN